MSRLSLKVLDRGFIEGYDLEYMYPDEDPVDRSVDCVLANANNDALSKIVNSKISSNIDRNEVALAEGGLAAWLKLFDENTSTTVILALTTEDHDGNPSYIESFDFEDREGSLKSDELLKEVITVLTDDDSSIEINGDTVTFDVKENLWFLSEDEETSISNIINYYIGKTVVLYIDNCSAIFDLSEVKEINQDFMDDLSYSIGSSID